MNMRLDSATLRTPTGPTGPATAPLPADAQLDVATRPAEPKPGDTSKLKTNTGEITAAAKVDIEHVDLEGHGKPEGAEKEKEGPEAGELLERLGEKTEVKGLKKGAAILNAPQVAMHVVEGAEMVMRHPQKALKKLEDIAQHPLDHAGDAATLAQQGHSTIKTAKEVGEIGLESAKRLGKNVAEHGLGKGLVETAKETGHELKQVGKELKENFSHATGGGLKNAPKVVAKETEELAAKNASKAMKKFLAENVPEMAPKGFIGKMMAKAEKTLEPVTKLAEKGAKTLEHTAEKFADRGVAVLEKSKLGKGVVNTLEKMHPHYHVPKEALTKAVEEGQKAGTKTAMETTTKLLEKNGVKLTEDMARAMEHAGAEAATKTAAKVGAEAAGKGLGRFAPGVNIAIAGYDAYHATQVWRDPKSTGWQKGMATATAVFSAAAATNIPIVSQVGAGLSIATSVLENVKPESIKHAAEAVGGWVSKGISKLKFW